VSRAKARDYYFKKPLSGRFFYCDLDEEHFRKILPEICAPFESLAPDVMGFCQFHIILGLLYYTEWDIERTEELCEGLSRREYIDNCKEYIRESIEIERPSNTYNQFFLKDPIRGYEYEFY